MEKVIIMINMLKFMSNLSRSLGLSDACVLFWQVSSILRKKNDSLTLDDKQVLEENAELVEEYHKRWGTYDALLISYSHGEFTLSLL